MPRRPPRKPRETSKFIKSINADVREMKANKKRGKFVSVYSPPRDIKGRFLPKPIGYEAGLAGAPKRFDTKKSKTHDAVAQAYLYAGQLPNPDIVEGYRGSNLTREGSFKYGWRFEGLGGKQIAADLLRRLAFVSVDVPGLLAAVVVKSRIATENGKTLGSASNVDTPQKVRKFLLEEWESGDSAQVLLEQAGDNIWWIVYAYSPEPLFGSRAPKDAEWLPRLGAVSTLKRTVGTSKKGKPTRKLSRSAVSSRGGRKTKKVATKKRSSTTRHTKPRKR